MSVYKCLFVVMPDLIRYPESIENTVIPAPVLRSTTKDECPESFLKKDSGLASLAGMTNDCSLYTDSI